MLLAMATTRSSLPVLLLDFDGTLCIGDAPVLAYAEEACRDLTPDQANVLVDTLRSFLSGALGARWEDGYDAVHALATPTLTEEQLSGAYTRSRSRLAAGTLPVTTPAGLVDFLTSLAPHARRVLVTNAPLRGVEHTLGRLGLDPVLDLIVPDAGKPDGWTRVLPQILGDAPAQGSVSVGDVYRNDIAPLIPTDIATAFIDRFGATGLPATPTWSAASFPDLYPALSRWFTPHPIEGH